MGSSAGNCTRFFTSDVDTRWSARIDAVKPLVKRPREIVQALNELQEEFDLTSDLS